MRRFFLTIFIAIVIVPVKVSIAQLNDSLEDLIFGNSQFWREMSDNVHFAEPHLNSKLKVNNHSEAFPNLICEKRKTDVASAKVPQHCQSNTLTDTKNRDTKGQNLTDGLQASCRSLRNKLASEFGPSAKSFSDLDYFDLFDSTLNDDENNRSLAIKERNTVCKCYLMEKVLQSKGKGKKCDGINYPGYCLCESETERDHQKLTRVMVLKNLMELKKFIVQNEYDWFKYALDLGTGQKDLARGPCLNSYKNTFNQYCSNNAGIEIDRYLKSLNNRREGGQSNNQLNLATIDQYFTNLRKSYESATLKIDSDKTREILKEDNLTLSAKVTFSEIERQNNNNYFRDSKEIFSPLVSHCSPQLFLGQDNSKRAIQALFNGEDITGQKPLTQANQCIEKSLSGYLGPKAKPGKDLKEIMQKLSILENDSDPQRLLALKVITMGQSSTRSLFTRYLGKEPKSNLETKYASIRLAQFIELLHGLEQKKKRQGWGDETYKGEFFKALAHFGREEFQLSIPRGDGTIIVVDGPRCLRVKQRIKETCQLLDGKISAFNKMRQIGEANYDYILNLEEQGFEYVSETINPFEDYKSIYNKYACYGIHRPKDVIQDLREGKKVKTHIPLAQEDYRYGPKLEIPGENPNISAITAASLVREVSKKDFNVDTVIRTVKTNKAIKSFIERNREYITVNDGKTTRELNRVLESLGKRLVDAETARERDTQIRRAQSRPTIAPFKKELPTSQIAPGAARFVDAVNPQNKKPERRLTGKTGLERLSDTGIASELKEQLSKSEQKQKSLQDKLNEALGKIDELEQDRGQAAGNRSDESAQKISELEKVLRELQQSNEDLKEQVGRLEKAREEAKRREDGDPSKDFAIPRPTRQAQNVASSEEQRPVRAAAGQRTVVERPVDNTASASQVVTAGETAGNKRAGGSRYFNPQASFIPSRESLTDPQMMEIITQAVRVSRRIPTVKEVENPLSAQKVLDEFGPDVVAVNSNNQLVFYRAGYDTRKKQTFYKHITEQYSPEEIEDKLTIKGLREIVREMKRPGQKQEKKETTILEAAGNAVNSDAKLDEAKRMSRWLKLKKVLDQMRSQGHLRWAL